MVVGTVFCVAVGLFWKKGTQYKKFAFLTFRSLNENFVDFSQKNLRKFVKTTFKVSRGHFRRINSSNKIKKKFSEFEQKKIWRRRELFVRDGNFGFYASGKQIWSIVFLLKNSSLFQRFCTLKENFAAFGESFSAGLSFQRKFWRKTCWEKSFSFLTSWELSEFFNPFWKNNFISFDNFAFYVLIELFSGRNSVWKKVTFSSFLDVEGNVCGILAKCIQHINRSAFYASREAFSEIPLWILSEIYLPTIKTRQKCQVFILLAWRNTFKKKFFESKV